MAGLHRSIRAPGHGRCRRATLAGVALLAAAWFTLRPLDAFVPPASLGRAPVAKPALLVSAPQHAGLLLGVGAGAFAMEGVAFAEDDPAAYQTAFVVGGVDVIKLAYDLFFLVIVVLLFKNNLIDYNGPLAPLLGLEVKTARVSHILVEKEEQANGILAELKTDGAEPTQEAFAAVATAMSTCGSSKSGGNLGLIFEGTMAPEFDAVCFNDSKALNVVHGPVKTEFGHHLILISERFKGAPPAKEEEKAEAETAKVGA